MYSIMKKNCDAERVERLWNVPQHFILWFINSTNIYTHYCFLLPVLYLFYL